MCSEDSVLQGLGCHPPDRKQSLPALPVVIGLIDVSRHTKVWQKKQKHSHYLVTNLNLYYELFLLSYYYYYYGSKGFFDIINISRNRLVFF